MTIGNIHTILRWCVLIVMVALTTSCNKKQECFVPTDITAKMVYAKKRTVDTIITTDTTARDTVMIFYRDTLMEAPGMQTFLYDTNFVIRGQRGITTLQFSLDPDSTEMKYLVFPNYNNLDIHDTLTIKYRSQLYFISNDCGFTYNYQIDTAQLSNSVFDSASIMNRDVTTEGNIQHIRIYFFE